MDAPPTRELPAAARVPVAREPDDHSFDAFYRAKSDSVYRALAMTLGDAHLAREATDEAMTRACARWHAVRSMENPGGWAYRVGLNWATSWWRKRRREQPLWPDRDEAAVTDPQTPVALAALRRLPLNQRAVVVCRVLLDLSTVETADLLGLAQGTVKSRLARALAALRTVLTVEGEA
ncbi:sigma-70 family RNA polymerase sigma factor [Rugosimonospora acidiphila]